ncbi:hypothetical protein [Cellulomonas sp. Leaf395]|uniref:hypothetical protein n=1 Tax=Cellulomonas sp. Leaf395 TaxID=1736362 RepID=UPI0012FBF7C0|nr:hypothetical protein [Cellulomonas sp. Leaf395]
MSGRERYEVALDDVDVDGSLATLAVDHARAMPPTSPRSAGAPYFNGPFGHAVMRAWDCGHHAACLELVARTCAMLEARLAVSPTSAATIVGMLGEVLPTHATERSSLIERLMSELQPALDRTRNAADVLRSHQGRETLNLGRERTDFEVAMRRRAVHQKISEHNSRPRFRLDDADIYRWEPDGDAEHRRYWMDRVREDQLKRLLGAQEGRAFRRPQAIADLASVYIALARAESPDVAVDVAVSILSVRRLQDQRHVLVEELRGALADASERELVTEVAESVGRFEQAFEARALSDAAAREVRKEQSRELRRAAAEDKRAAAKASVERKRAVASALAERNRRRVAEAEGAKERAREEARVRLASLNPRPISSKY